MRYDWNRHGYPVTARFAATFISALCAMATGLFLWAAIALDWTVIFVALRERYGVREAPEPEPPPLADQVAEAVEAIRARQWAAVAEQAYLARPPATQTVSSLALGFSRIAAAAGPCAHRDAEPVDLLLTGERVAWVCPDCKQGLPADWA